MSGIFAAMVHSQSVPSAPLERLVKGSQKRGNDGVSVVTLNRSFSRVSRNRTWYDVNAKTGRGVFPPGVYGVLGCAYSRPAAGDHVAPPFINRASSWCVTVDGAITNWYGQQLAERLLVDEYEDWTEFVEDLEGQFAIVAMHRDDPRTLYYGCKAKPLYMLYDPIMHAVYIAQQPEYFYGMYDESRTPRPVRLGPYSCGEIAADGKVRPAHPLRHRYGSGSLMLCGGGLDSTVAAWDNAQTYADDTLLMYVDYGARARVKEWHATQSLAAAMASPHSGLVGSTEAVKVPFDFFRKHVASPLFPGGKPVSEHPQPGQATEWVPARNTVLMALAVSFAESNGLARIVTGINMEAAAAYPDNEEEWHRRWEQLLPYAVGDGAQIDLESPLRGMSKADIVRLGETLKVPWGTVDSWSCYNGGKNHCGQCSSCRARRGAFVRAQIPDVTRYTREPK
jgi:7-cyano-7-deazaguanine synthase